MLNRVGFDVSSNSTFIRYHPTHYKHITCTLHTKSHHGTLHYTTPHGTTQHCTTHRSTLLSTTPYMIYVYHVIEPLCLDLFPNHQNHYIITKKKWVVALYFVFGVPSWPLCWGRFRGCSKGIALGSPLTDLNQRFSSSFASVSSKPPIAQPVLLLLRVYLAPVTSCVVSAVQWSVVRIYLKSALKSSHFVMCD